MKDRPPETQTDSASDKQETFPERGRREPISEARASGDFWTLETDAIQMWWWEGAALLLKA